MKDFFKAVWPVFVIFALFSFLAIIFIPATPTKTAADTGFVLQLAMEQAYAEGQKDAISGDIRIKKIDGKWTWIKSPWNGHEKPAIYDISKME